LQEEQHLKIWSDFGTCKFQNMDFRPATIYILVKGREHIISKFDWEIVGNNYKRLFYDLVNQNG
jgi:hypothetical protein